MVKTRASKRILCLVLSLILITSTFVGFSLTSAAVTGSEIANYAKSRVSGSYQSGYCLRFVEDVYANFGISRCYKCCAMMQGRTYRVSSSRDNIPLGAEVYFNNSNSTCGTCGNNCGHIGIYVGNGEMVHASGGIIRKDSLSYVSNYYGWGWHAGVALSNENNPTSEPTGSEMTSGYARTIPDGDYVIASALGKFYLDILGSSTPEAEGSKIQLHECNGFWTDIPVFDVWTLKYNFDGFYSIYQKGTNVSLDVPNASVANRTALQVWNANNSAAQKWAIHDLGNGTCTIQAKCSGYAVDVRNAVAANETVIQQNVVNESAAQQWRFIPYKPTVTESNKVASATYNGHEYILYKKLMTWNDARDWCKNQGGNLVTITSSGEQNAVESLMSKVSNRIWLGASDAESEGNWKWVTGEIFNYSNWESGEPNNNPASYGGYENFMELSATGTWNDVEEYVKTIEYFILEKTHTHTSDSGTITKQPTCTGTGTKTYKCTVCKETIKTETVAAAGHKSQSVAAVAATCTAKGKTAGTKCSVCGATLSGLTETAALGHDYKSSVTTQPTCTEEGVKTYKCSRCTSSYTEKVSALGHTNLDGNGNCTRCGAHIKDVVNPDACPYCGQVHDGIFGRIVAFFHKVIYFIDQLF